MCTMFAKNGIPGSASVLGYRQELEQLYARRSAIDSLIESLEEYNRCRESAHGDDRERRGRVQGAPRASAPRPC
jgi:hypothetical protein